MEGPPAPCIVRAVRRTTVDERRREILETTCRVVIERGFANTRVSDVANALGISTGLIHYHFDSKGTLFAEAMRHASEEDLARLAASVAQGTTAAGKLDQVFQMYSPSESEPGWLLWIDSWGEALRSPELRVISQELDDAWQRTIESIIREGVATGEFTCDDPHGAAWRLTALLDGLGVQLTVHQGVITRTQMIEWVREAAAKELGVQPTALGARAPRRNAGERSNGARARTA